MSATHDPSGGAADASAAEIASLRLQLAEAHEVIDAIRDGRVDAVVVKGEQGELVYTLSGADAVYRELIESMAEGAVALSPAGEILYCNVSVANTLGYPISDLIGVPLVDHVPPAQRAGLTSLLAQARNGRGRGELSLQTRRGDTRPVHLSITAVRTDGVNVLFCLVATDLTEARRLEEIAAADRLSRSILEQAAESIIVCDADGRIMRLSRAAERLCGRNAIQRRLHETLDLQVEGDGAFDVASVLQGETVHQVDVGVDAPDGRLHLLLSASPLQSGDRVVGCVINLTDITLRTRLNQTLRIRMAALDAAANAIVIADKDGRITWANRAFTTLSGFEIQEGPSDAGHYLVDTTMLDAMAFAELWQTILAGRVWHGEVTGRRKDGSTYPEDLIITPVLDSLGAVSHLVALKRDLTEEHTVQGRLLQSQRMETVGRLAGGVAHDFNNILTAIGGLIELDLQEVPPTSPLHSDLEEVQRSVQRAAALTRQLLAFSRKQNLQPRMVDCNELVLNLQKMLGRLLGDDIRLELNLRPGIGTVLVDPGQLEQIVTNLCVNARDAMPTGGLITIESDSLTADQPIETWNSTLPAGSYVTLTVRDAGVGMSPETLTRIFEPFFTTKGVGKGTGLGLATVHGIAAQSGGGMQVRSEIGKGSEFRLLLPRVAGEVAEAQAQPRSTPSFRGRVVLLVDDNTLLRGVATRLLAKMDITVLSAGGGPEAIRLVETYDGPLDLLLTDVVMPDMSGPDLAARIQRLRPGLRVLFMSGYTSDMTIQHGIDTGHTFLLDKPFTSETLSAKLRECWEPEARSRE